MPSLRIYQRPKIKTKITPRLIEKLKILSLSYPEVQSMFGKNQALPEQITDTYSKNLEEHLLEQIKTLKIDNNLKKILLFLVNELDNNGLFSNWTKTKENLKKTFSVSERTAYNSLETFQNLEPEGVGATSVKNFLEIQIKKYLLEDKAFEKLCLTILKEEKLLIENNINQLAENLNTTKEEINKALDFIRNNINHVLPGKQFNSASAIQIKPSLELTTENNKFKLLLLEDYTDVYDQKLFDFLKERSKLLKLIMDYFLENQDYALYKQTGFFKPVQQKETAEAIGVNPSTLSRIINNKYLILNNKVFLLRTLFQRRVKKSEISTEYLRALLSTPETKNKTDLMLSKELTKKGVFLARRTVNYYRHRVKN